MPPRPRPRRATPAVLTAPSPSPPTPHARAKKIEDDEDALFMRNQGRSLREANRRAARAEAVALAVAPLSDADADADADEEGDAEEPPGKKQKQNSCKAHALPVWAKKGAILHMLEGPESDSEAENKPARRRGDTPARKRARSKSRSRSRSLTPAPGLTQAEALRAHQAIQHALGGGAAAVRVSSSPEIEDDGDGAVLDPELQRIARAIRDRAQRRTGGAQCASGGAVEARGLGGGPADVRVRVRWVAHPEDTAMRARSQTSWSFTVDRYGSLKGLFLQMAAKVHVSAEDLVIMRDGWQVFTSVSLDGLGVWDEAELEACERGTFEALRWHQFRSPTPAQHNGECERGTSEGSVSGGDAEEKMKLVLRAAGVREVTLSVRPRTTCGKIVRAFLAVAGKQGDGKPGGKVQLCIDGERQNADTAIVDCDVEDGDMVEVVGF